MNCRLADGAIAGNHGAVFRKPVEDREDVTAIIEAMFDIRRELARIRVAVEENEDDGEAAEED